jgi:hypothetical protein
MPPVDLVESIQRPRCPSSNPEWEGLYPRFDGRGAEASCAWSWVTEHGTVLAQPTHTRGRLSHGVVAATIDTHLDKMLAAEPVPTPVQELG